MTDREQIDFPFFNVKCVDDPIITDTQSVTIPTLHSMMGKIAKPRAHLINPRLDSPPHIGRKIVKDTVESGIINLKRPAHGESRLTQTRPFSLRNIRIHLFQ